MTLSTVPRYERDQLSELGDRAVVVGGSIAGLLTARVLADGFRDVVVVERDPIPTEPTPRRGVPQGNHIHALLRAGRATIEDLFPGYGEQLLSAGGVQIDMGSDVLHYEDGDFVADSPTRLPTYYATRPLIEYVVWQRVLELDSVTVRSQCQCVEYSIDGPTPTVDGVTLRDDDGEYVDISTDLVVDATGRTSTTPTWLDDAGFRAPPADEVRIDMAYSTVFSERPPDDRRALIVPPAEDTTRGVGVFPVEDGRWLLTYFGMHGDHPPTTPRELREFSSNLPGPDPVELFDTEPTFSDDIVHYPFPSNRRYRYEELERFPDGLVVIGDAIASFNPIYGQGMSVAALEALVLHHVLATDASEGLPLRFFDRVESVVDVAWSMAVGADFQYSETTGPKPRGTDFFNWYLSRLTHEAHSDGSLRETYYRVINMEYPPRALVRPAVLWRVLNPF